MKRAVQLKRTFSEKETVDGWVGEYRIITLRGYRALAERLHVGVPHKKIPLQVAGSGRVLDYCRDTICVSHLSYLRY